MRPIPAAKRPDDVPFAAWRELGADAVVFGTVQQSGGKTAVQVRLMNVRIAADGLRQGVFQREQSARVRAHHRRRNPPAAARPAGSGADETGVRLRSEPRQPGGTIEKREVKEIYIADYDGANQRRITVSRQLNLTPSWSADGRALAYTTYRPSPDIFVSFIYQGLLQNPTKGVGTNYIPVFSPDGTRIAFMSGRDGNPEIYVMNVDGSNLRRLTNHPAGDGDADVVAQQRADRVRLRSNGHAADLPDVSRRLERAPDHDERVVGGSADVVASARSTKSRSPVERARRSTSRFTTSLRARRARSRLARAPTSGRRTRQTDGTWRSRRHEVEARRCSRSAAMAAT